MIEQNILLLQILHKTENHRFIQNDNDSAGVSGDVTTSDIENEECTHAAQVLTKERVILPARWGIETL